MVFAALLTVIYVETGVRAADFIWKTAVIIVILMETLQSFVRLVRFVKPSPLRGSEI